MWSMGSNKRGDKTTREEDKEARNTTEDHFVPGHYELRMRICKHEADAVSFVSLFCGFLIRSQRRKMTDNSSYSVQDKETITDHPFGTEQ